LRRRKECIQSVDVSIGKETFVREDLSGADIGVLNGRKGKSAEESQHRADEDQERGRAHVDNEMDSSLKLAARRRLNDLVGVRVSVSID
jgi:hypothetical protein